MNERNFISTLLQYVGTKFSAKLPGNPAEVVVIFLCLHNLTGHGLFPLDPY